MSTCQICGREIKSKNGVIAHHGYRRPEYGWQTQSCFGARHLPYELSCGAIPLAIDHLKEYIKATKKALENAIKNPPESLERSEYTGYASRQMVTYPRPDGFNSLKEDNSYSFREGYKLAFFAMIHSMKKSIESAEGQIEYLENRLKNWTLKGK